MASTAMHFRIRAILRRQVIKLATLPITGKRQIFNEYKTLTGKT